MICENCKVENPDGSKFCFSCGAKMSVEKKPLFCSECGNELKEGTKFCHSCGAQVSKSVDSVSRNVSNNSGNTPVGNSASVGSRIGAYFLDVIIMLAPILLMLVIGSAASALYDSSLFVICLGIGYFISLVLGIVQIVQISAKGQSFGKKIMKIKIVLRDTNQNGGFVTNIIKRAVLLGLLSSVTFGIYGLIDVITFLSKKGASLHDNLAKTKVVKV